MFYICLQAVEAETTYKACVAEANSRQQELEKIKVRECRNFLKSSFLTFPVCGTEELMLFNLCEF